ncbi:hypothetical protein CB1_000437006 [Camelus ferus]|nr:hypothetical protein CB1_000437006 [Camelus ferus]
MPPTPGGSQGQPHRYAVLRQDCGNKWEAYLGLLQAEHTEGNALEALSLKPYCCCHMLLAHMGLIEKLLNACPWRGDMDTADSILPTVRPPWCGDLEAMPALSPIRRFASPSLERTIQ